MNCTENRIERKKQAGARAAFAAFLFALASLAPAALPALAQIDDAADLHTQQQQEKGELEDMKRQMQDIRGNMENALKDMSKVQSMMRGDQIKEFHLQAKESAWEVLPGYHYNAMTYNNQTPGPAIRVSEGDQVRLVLHNGLKTASSLYIQGMQLPHKVDGLPKKGAGLVGPGETFVYQFIAQEPGTFYYRPQLPHLDQMLKGLVGVIIVEPRSIPKTYEKDQVIVLTQVATHELSSKGGAKPSGAHLFLANGKSAQAINPIELRRGERVRLRVVNASPSACPLTLTGHKFELVAQNGSSSVEPHVKRDTVTVHPGERVDLEFSAENPGVWSLSSLESWQTTFNGQFPGGFAIVVRYPEAMN